MITSKGRALQGKGSHHRASRRPARFGLILLALPLVWGGAPAAWGASRTAESIWSQRDAEQQAIDQIPVEDRQGITNTRCQEVGVGRMGSLPRFRCTVWFTPTAKPSDSAQPPPK